MGPKIHCIQNPDLKWSIDLCYRFMQSRGLAVHSKERLVGEEMRTTPELSFKNFVCLSGLFLLVFASLLVPRLAAAQTATGTIVGTVTDPKGLPASDVSVVVRNVDTETASSYPTNSPGIYVAPYLQPGTYQVTRSESGFDTVVTKNVDDTVGEGGPIAEQIPLHTP